MNEISLRKAATINFASKYTGIFIQLLCGAVLARILSPSDFGIIAVITVFSSFVSMLADMGITPGIIQNKELNTGDIEGIFSFTVYAAVFLAALFAAFSIPLSMLYGNSAYKPVGAVLAAALLFNTINTVPNALLLKNKSFKTLGVRLISISGLSGILTIALALAGFRFYAIAVSSAASSFLTLVWNLKGAHLRFSFKLNMSGINKIKEFSFFQYAFSVVNYFSRNLDNLLIGKLMGSEALAYYDKGYKLMLYPVNNLTHSITPVLQPVLSDFDKELIYEKYLKIVKLLSLLGVFITAYCFFSAEEIILIIFGDKWTSSIPCFRLLALSVWAQMITAGSGSIFQSLGSTRLLLITGIINTAITIAAICVGVYSGDIYLVSGCVAGAYIAQFFSTHYILIKRGFGKKYLRFLKTLLPDTGIFLIVSAGLLAASRFEIDSSLLSALFKLIIGAGAYACGVRITGQRCHYVF